MRIIIITLVLCLLTGSAFSKDKTAPESYQVKKISFSNKAASESGNLEGPATFNRPHWPNSNPVDLSCSGAGASSSSFNPYYSIHPVYSPTGEDLIAAISSGFDSYLLLYCDPFIPADPLLNLRFGDDDGIDFAGDAAFFAADNVYLEPDTQYYLVVTSYPNSTSGAYTLTVDGDVVFGTLESGPEEPHPTPISARAVFFSALIMAGFIFVGIRKIR